MSLRPDLWFESLTDDLPEEYEAEYDDDLISAVSVIQGTAEPEMAGELFETVFAEAEDSATKRLTRLIFHWL